MGDPTNVPAAPGNTNNVTVPTRTFNEVKTVSLEFVGDHAMLKDNAADWTKTGNAIAKPEFMYGKKSAPISRTKDNLLAVKIELEVWPYEAPQMQCTIKGAATWGQTFETNFPLKGGRQTVILESAEKLPDNVVKLAGDIEWVVDNGADGPMKADHSWGHEVYVTMGTPVDAVGMPEVGITLKRMSAAVDLVSRAGSLDPYAIVGWLMRLVPEYTLDTNKDVPAEYLHPKYNSKSVGAWPLVDWLQYKAECQAICRLVGGIIKHVGCPGTAKVVLIWADPDYYDGSKALEADYNAGGGLGRKAQRSLHGDPCDAVLVDAYPEEGVEYQTFDKDAPNYMGVNQFEACLRFECDGQSVKYYGGGAGVYDSPDPVLTAFSALCWVCTRADIINAPTKQYSRVVQVVKRWRDRNGELIK